MSEKAIIIRVTLEDREPSGLRVWSRDLPGLVLSGPEREAVWSAIAPSIKLLLERQGLKDVSVVPAEPIDQVLRRDSPRDVDMQIEAEAASAVHEEQFVASFLAAA